ncbi:unnamed protein product [Orchesella dallaii]|uniref:DUF5641 domain-containing protein n=1 Tax=Orchesella dallaii TaxID=48710 RepID=A0ABP1RW65_9HEXA
MQEIWTLKFGWDEPLPTEIQQQWKDYCSQLQDIRKVIIPRCITVSSSARYEIHGFCDASERAYGVVLYLRAIGNDGQIKVSFITSKAKVAPLKQVTLARLELIGAVMLSKLMNNVQLIMKLDCELFAWCDSTIVLRWIAAHPRRWKTFVANRVAQIQEHTPVEIWRHVPGIQNPADLASRGITATELNNNVFWWNGPPWLQHHQIPLFHTSPASDSSVTEELTQVGIQWHFNSPSSPHHGGLWEAGVKSAKYHLKRVIGDANFNFEQFQTVLCQVEAVLNSRPLCPVSADPTDLNVLTPGHFLIGERLTSVPDDPLIEIKENRLSIWQRQQQRVQHFWRRWRMEYLNTLQQRNKWFRTEDNFRVGDMVILKEDNEGPGAWKIRRIADVHPGTDGNVRVVSVRTSTGILKRPIAKLIMLLDKNLI